MGPFTGINLIARAATEIMKRPRLVLMGMLPPLLVTLLYIVVAWLGGPALVDTVNGSDRSSSQSIETGSV